VNNPVKAPVNNPVETLLRLAAWRATHRVGTPSRIDTDPELRAFVEARIATRTFADLVADIADAFPPQTPGLDIVPASLVSPHLARVRHGPGQSPSPKAPAKGTGQRHRPKAPAKGTGQRHRPKAPAKGTGTGPARVRHGSGTGPARVRHGSGTGPARVRHDGRSSRPALSAPACPDRALCDGTGARYDDQFPSDLRRSRALPRQGP